VFNNPFSLSHRDLRALRLETLMRLRWLAIAGQATSLIVIGIGFGFPLPYIECIALITAAVILNIVLTILYPASHRLSEKSTTVQLGFDIIQLSLLLFFTGGLQNPFSMLFLAPVLICATTLPPSRTLTLGCLAMVCASVLAIFYQPLPWYPAEPLQWPLLYRAGIWTALLLTISFIAVHAWRVAEETRQLEKALNVTELVLEREQHLSQLDGLAASAAHELGTPLGTITVVVRELQKTVSQDSPLYEDIVLLRQQAERCRVILSQLTSLHVESPDMMQRITLTHLLEEVMAPHRSEPVALDLSIEGEGEEPVLKRNPGLVHALANLMDNALDFAESRVMWEARWNAENVCLTLKDDGPGFAPDILLRGGDPYLTTRGYDKRGEYDIKAGYEPEYHAPAAGHGLGLFIAKTLIERSGASLSLSNGAVKGAIVTITWPKSAFEAG
jgi:two-component system, sensor histidine kinase RegB